MCRAMRESGFARPMTNLLVIPQLLNPDTVAHVSFTALNTITRAAADILLGRKDTALVEIMNHAPKATAYTPYAASWVLLGARLTFPFKDEPASMFEDFLSPSMSKQNTIQERFDAMANTDLGRAGHESVVMGPFFITGGLTLSAMSMIGVPYRDMAERHDISLEAVEEVHCLFTDTDLETCIKVDGQVFGPVSVPRAMTYLGLEGINRFLGGLGQGKARMVHHDRMASFSVIVEKAVGKST